MKKILMLFVSFISIMILVSCGTKKNIKSIEDITLNFTDEDIINGYNTASKSSITISLNDDYGTERRFASAYVYKKIGLQYYAFFVKPIGFSLEKIHLSDDNVIKEFTSSGDYTIVYDNDGANQNGYQIEVIHFNTSVELTPVAIPSSFTGKTGDMVLNISSYFFSYDHQSNTYDGTFYNKLNVGNLSVINTYDFCHSSSSNNNGDLIFDIDGSLLGATFFRYNSVKEINDEGELEDVSIQGVSKAVNVETIKKAVSYIEAGKTNKPLNIIVEERPVYFEETLPLPTDNEDHLAFLYVTKVYMNSIFDGSEIRGNDLIYSVNGIEVINKSDFYYMCSLTTITDIITIEKYRTKDGVYIKSTISK